MIFPALPQTAQAEEAESKVSLSVAPVISLSLQDTVAVEVTPTQDGTFRSNTATLSISTNNETGYSLYMATGNGKNTLTSQNPSISNVISAVNGGEDGVASANFGNNTWGYNLSQEAVSDTTAYKAVPTATGDTALITTESPTEADTYNLTFGTKVDTSLPSGTYSNDVVVSVVANPAFVPVFDGIQTMQEMTSTICADAAENDTAQLTDTRDGKKYWVTKLADGNCWMTQNLDLDLSTDVPLTPDSSDVVRTWVPTVNTSTTIFDNADSDGAYSYDPDTTVGSTGLSLGNYYQYNAATAGTLSTSTTGGQTSLNSICPRNWRLPSKDDFGGLTSLRQAEHGVYEGLFYGQATLPGYWTVGGYLRTGWGENPGDGLLEGEIKHESVGFYWINDEDSYIVRLAYMPFVVDPDDMYDFYSGIPVRCIAR